MDTASAGGGVVTGLNLDRLAELLREYADRKTGYIYADEVAVLRAAADGLERVRTLEAVAEAARVVVKVAGSYREDGIPVSPAARALHEALAAAGGGAHE